MMICGIVVLDICQHIVERWNEIKKREVMSSMGDVCRADRPSAPKFKVHTR